MTRSTRLATAAAPFVDMVSAGSGLLAADMALVAFAPWPHWSSLRPNSVELADPGGDRTLRVVLCERLAPGGATAMAADNVPAHRNSYDVLTVTLQLAQVAGGGPMEVVDGAVTLRPEGLFCPAMEPLPKVPPSSNHVFNLAIHTDGPSGEPLVTLEEIAAILPVLEKERPGSVLDARGEYVGADGAVHELLEVCWARKEGRPFPYPSPSRLNAPLSVAVAAVPWADAANGVACKPMFAPGGAGPAAEILRLEAGAGFSDDRAEGHRLVVVVDGAVRSKAGAFGPQGVLYAPPGQALGAIESEPGALLFSMEFGPKDGLLPRPSDPA